MTASSLSSTPEFIEGGTSAQRAAVGELVRDLGRSLRLHLMYEGSNPALDRYVEALRGRMGSLWSELPVLTLEVKEHELLWKGTAVYEGETRSDDLAFLLYRDGLRELTFLPEFEVEELLLFLDVLARGQRLRGEDDDLLTLLWARDWRGLRYRYVEPLPEGVSPPAPSGEPPEEVEAPRQEASEVVSTVSKEDFDGALYFLDEAEFRKLTLEIRREMARDLWTDVSTALLDCLECGTPVRQMEVAGILSELFPTLLGAGKFAVATRVLREMVELATRPDALPGPVLRRIRVLFDQLARPATVQELVRTTEEDPTAEMVQGLASLLGFFPPSALEGLLLSLESVRTTEVRAAVLSAADRLAGSDGAPAIALLSSADERVAGGAAGVIARRGIPEAAPELAKLLARPQVGLRLAAVQALTALRSPSAAGALLRVMDDADREVRIAAIRALGVLRYTPAKRALKEAVESKALREADISEKIAVYESFGIVGGEEAVPELARVLNGKSWLGRREPPEIRACAALALGRIAHPTARQALAAAAADAEPVVRSAVGRALRGSDS